MNALARLSRLWRGCCLRMIPLRRLLSLHFIKTLQLPFPFRSLTDLVHSHIQRVNSLHRSLRTRRPIYARARAARPRRALLNKRAKLFHIKYQIDEISCNGTLATRFSFSSQLLCFLLCFSSYSYPDRRFGYSRSTGSSTASSASQQPC